MTRTVSQHRLVSVLVGLAMIAVAAAGYGLSQPQNKFQVVRGTVGELNRYNKGSVEASDVRIGTKLLDGSAEATTPGVFVVVHLSVRAPGEQEVHIQHAELLARGDTRYQAFTTGEQVFAEPGFETSRDVAFEVDPNRMEDLTVQVWDAKIVDGYHQRLRIHLGITANNAEQWKVAAQDQRLRIDTDDVSRGLS